jgi:hypothetical protein
MSVLEWLLAFYTKNLAEISFPLVSFYVSKKMSITRSIRSSNKRVSKLGRGGVVWVINLNPYQAPKTNLDI